MIFSYFKRKEKALPSLKVDMHSHLIPGIDDGPASIKESLEILKHLEQLGYQKVIITPHIMYEGYTNTQETILQGLVELREAVEKENINIHIDAAAEYYIDEGFDRLLDNDELLRISGKYILLETSYIAKPLNFEEVIFKLLSKGYFPILAHPERYRYIKNLDAEYHTLKKHGILFQVNINSFSGHYGKDAQKKALYLSKKGLIDFLGTDIHHLKHFHTLKEIIRTKTFYDIFKHNTIMNDNLNNK